jgi:hypothetical protein
MTRRPESLQKSESWIGYLHPIASGQVIADHEGAALLAVKVCDYEEVG